MLDAAGLFERYGTLLQAGGTNRLQRTLPALGAGYVLPDERSLSRLFAYAAEAAGLLNFHALSGQAAGTWSPLFDPLRDAEGAILSDAGLEALMAGRSDLPPQLALMFAFFEAFARVQEDFNRLPARHLAHYYEDVLGLQRRAAEPDRVHVVFELARNAAPTRLEAGALLDAGTDAEGRQLKYALERDIVVTRARIAAIERQVAERDPQGRLRLFRAGPVGAESWPTFGADPFAPGTAAATMVETDPGFAVADPVLRLAEGARQIAIVVRLRADGPVPPQTLTPHVTVELTGEEGWLAPASAAVVLGQESEGPVLTITATLGEDQPAVVDHDAGLHGTVAAPWPVLRCLVRSNSGKAELFAGLAAQSVEIAVEADGLADLVAQNEQRTLDPTQPIALFGQRPKVGANFYIGSREAFSKRLTRLTLDLAWDGLPDDLLAHYHEYFDLHDSVLASLFLPSFSTVVDLLDGRSWDHRITGPAGRMRLFTAGSGRQTVTFAGSALTASYGDAPYRADSDLPEADRYEVGTKRGFLRLQLAGPRRDDLTTFGVPFALKVPFEAFGHDAFAKRYAQAVIALAQYDPDAPGAGPEPVLPNQPYTPTLSELRLGYGASSAFSPADVQAAGRVYTIGAYGHTTASATVEARLGPPLDARAAIFLGAAGFEPPGTLSVLFQLDEGTATVAEPPGAGDIHWSYLAGDRWVSLPASALAVDETRGFQTSGIAAIAVGADATTEHTAMPAGLTWLRAVLDKPAEATARTLALHAQAASAVFSPGDAPLTDYTGHLAAGLLPGAIGRLDQRRAAIRSVSQPYSSTGGRAAETDGAFFERTAERLRHRGRAVTAWDFEHRVLERFDGIFKVRALPHSDADAAPGVGELSLVIVPNLITSQSSNRLEPRAGETLMQEARDFVASGIATPFAKISVIHPVYERVRVIAEVAFRPGFDAGYHAEQLNQDLQRFLSPWAFEDGRDIVFGTRIYRSELIKFVEDRPYVDYVTRFDVYHAFEGAPRGGIGAMEIGLDFVIGADPEPAVGGMAVGRDFVIGRPVEAPASTRPQAVLVSHPSHVIEPILPGAESCAGVGRLGIGYMIVGLDFETSEP